MKVFTTFFALAFIFEATISKYLLVELEGKDGHAQTFDAGKNAQILIFCKYAKV